MTIRDSGALSDSVAAAMREVAETVILPRFKQLADHDIRTKSSPADFVTVADEESERILTARLKDFLPGALVIGEEAAAVDPDVLAHLSSKDFVWIVDPIDGTANFVNGRPTFAVMIALVRAGETRMGWIHAPIENRTLTAERGAGTWRKSMVMGAAVVDRLAVASPSADLSAMVAGIYNPALAPAKGRFKRVVRQGSAAHDYWALVENRMQVLCFRRMKPWDHAAGALMHTEAGGFNRLLSGEPYVPSSPGQVGILCAPSRDIWRAVAALAN